MDFFLFLPSSTFRLWFWHPQYKLIVWSRNNIMFANHYGIYSQNIVLHHSDKRNLLTKISVNFGNQILTKYKKSSWWSFLLSRWFCFTSFEGCVKNYYHASEYVKNKVNNFCLVIPKNLFNYLKYLNLSGFMNL